MKATGFLRIASLVALLQFLAHTFLLVTYVPRHGPEEVAVVEAMKAYRFSLGGVVAHSYWDLYFGYGLMAAVNCLIEAVLFWQLAGLARSNPSRIKPIVGLFLAANLVHAILVGKYFFLVIPMVTDVLIAICLGVALMSGGSAGEEALPHTKHTAALT